MVLSFLAKRQEIRENDAGFKLDLAILRTCRQIHREAALIPYESNKFAFSKGEDFDLFVSAKLNAQQRQAIQRIQFTEASMGYSTRPSTMLSLHSLSSVEITVHPIFGDPFIQETRQGDRGEDPIGLWPLYGLGLDSARVHTTPNVVLSAR